MVFSSFTFLLLFLPITLVLYYVIPKNKKNWRNIILLVMSLVFYAFGEPIYVLLMIFSIIINYIFGIMIDKLKIKKALLIISIVFNIGLLFFYKYADFLINNINSLFNLDIKYLNLSLPIGISFYTFQILSYVIDVYQKKVDVQKNIFTLATYICLFPQLIAGPIVRYITVEDELNNRNETISNFSDGLRRFIVGLAKKVIIANNVAILADAIFNSNPNDVGSMLVWLGAIGYTLQIYFDFSGYSDMAIGLGKMFGFNFLENFNYPYIATSITDFWRRWHMSLSTWFRDYIYIPLGGNRVSKSKWLRNILIVWLLTGLWHGASWNYILWGFYFGLILILEKLYINKIQEKLPKIVNHLYALLFIVIGWVIFRVEDFNMLISFMVKLFNFSSSNLLDFININPQIIYTWPYVILGLIGSVPFIGKVFKKMNQSKNKWLGIICDFAILILFGLVIVYLISSSYNPFIYFRF